MRRDVLYLSDILEALDEIAQFLAGMTEAHFLADNLRKSAVLQKLTLIGEAATRLSAETKIKAPAIPWQKIVGLRNIAVHAYFNVDWAIIWSTATTDIATLRPQIEELISNTVD